MEFLPSWGFHSSDSSLLLHGGQAAGVKRRKEQRGQLGS